MAKGTLIVQFQQRYDPDDDDLEFRYEIEELADKRLRAAGLGHCDGGDIGSGTLNVFCLVSDAEKACDALVQAFDDLRLEGALIAFIEDGLEDVADPCVLWPKNFSGRFSVI